MERKILFVCTGNTCRSAMAEAIAKIIFDKNGIKAVVASRGIFADGGRISENAKKTLNDKYGFDASEHIPKRLVIEDLQDFDIILTMTAGHKYYIFENFEGFNDKVLTLKEYTEYTDKDISDPFGLSLDIYEKCAVEIEECIKNLLIIMVGEQE